jgi:2-polyprenyl-6-methoxyphenol hydroxylase-like FAD-dependent oxidoreductase
MASKTVLISGAGIAGPTLAFWLNAAGFKTTIVERAPKLRTGGYVVDFWGLGYDIAERMGLAAGLESVGYHVRELRVVGRRGRRLAGFGTAAFRALTGGRFITLRRSDLSRLLFEAACPSSEVLFDDEIVSLRERTNSVRVQFRSAGERDFDLVVGADGLSSNVRRLAFGPQSEFERPLGFTVAAFEIRGYRPREEDVYVIFNEPGRMVGRVALNDDETLFLFVFADAGSRPPPHDLEAQRAILRTAYGSGEWECAKILDRLDDVTELYFDRVSQIKMDAWSRGRVALVGDAAFCVSLMAGQGSALAITAAYVLAGELKKAGGDHNEAFQTYDALLRRFIATKQKGAERFSAAFAPSTAWGIFLRNQVVNACAIPLVARFAFGREITDTLRLPDYAWRKAERVN